MSKDNINISVQIIFIDSQSITEFDEELKELQFKPKFGKTIFFAESRILFVGTEYKNKSTTIDPFAKPDYYALGAIVGKQVKEYEVTDLKIDSHVTFAKKELELIILGIMQAGVDFDKYLSEKTSCEFEIYLSERMGGIVDKQSYKYINSLNAGIGLTRNLVDDTPQAINPSTMPAIIDIELDSPKITIKKYSFEELEKMGMEGITNVGKASIHKPNMVHTILKPIGETKKKIVLVGKGLTYDSGGLDIKTGGHMKGMKCDMAGSATMFGVIKTLMNLDLQNVEVHWISAFAENMVDGNSYKADDILTTYSGLTVEVDNTDAEGRLTLADVLTFATTLEPDYIIDAATLTGACMAALGHETTALMSNNEEFKSKLITQFEIENEPTLWVNMSERMRKAVKGDISDLMNTSNMERQCGHATAGLFLSHFVDQNLFRNEELKTKNPKIYPWIHLDIAGSAYNEKTNSLKVSGATGQSVRTLVNWILSEDIA
jgi:leucyl aminopeptidase